MISCRQVLDQLPVQRHLFTASLAADLQSEPTGTMCNLELQSKFGGGQTVEVAVLPQNATPAPFLPKSRETVAMAAFAV